MASKPSEDQFTILYFAAASSFAGTRDEKLPAPLPLKDLFKTLEKRYPGITEDVLQYSVVTVNLDYKDMKEGEGGEDSKTIIQAGDEVAIIPPVSAG